MIPARARQLPLLLQKEGGAGVTRENGGQWWEMSAWRARRQEWGPEPWGGLRDSRSRTVPDLGSFPAHVENEPNGRAKSYLPFPFRVQT